MCDLFRQSDAQALLKDKKVVVIGDSNMRGLYKDMVCLLNKNEILDQSLLRAKMESSFLNDRLLKSGRLDNARDFMEEREYCERGYEVQFYFVTRCYSKYVENNIITTFLDKQPDIVIMNSCLWDISRWGPSGVEKYKENLKTLVKRLKEVLHPKCLFIWTTTMPVSQNMTGGFLIAQVEFLRHQIRFELMEANLYAWSVMSKNGFDVLDLHYYMQMNIARRVKDGVHWINSATRHITNYVLTHIALALDIVLPGRLQTEELDEMISTPIFPQFNDETEPNKDEPPPKKKKLLRPHRRLGDRR